VGGVELQYYTKRKGLRGGLSIGDVKSITVQGLKRPKKFTEGGSGDDTMLHPDAKVKRGCRKEQGTKALGGGRTSEVDRNPNQTPWTQVLTGKCASNKQKAGRNQEGGKFSAL